MELSRQLGLRCGHCPPEGGGLKQGESGRGSEGGGGEEAQQETAKGGKWGRGSSNLLGGEVLQRRIKERICWGGSHEEMGRKLEDGSDRVKRN